MTGRKFVTAITLAACLSAASVRGQTPNMATTPIDEVRDVIVARLTLAAAAASGPAAPFTYLIGQSLREFGQSILWILALDVDAAIMEAWTMQSLLSIDRQIHSAVSYTGPMLAKLCEDRAALEASTKEAYLNKKNDETTAVNEAKLEAITRVMEDLRSPKFAPLAPLGKKLLDQFEDLRKKLLGGGVYARKGPAPPPPPQSDDGKKKDDSLSNVGARSSVASYFTPDMLGADWQMTADLVKYVQLVQEVETLVATPKQIGPLGQTRDVMAGADAHLRLLVTNQSSDLVYFVRVQPGPNAGARQSYRIPTDPSNGCVKETATREGDGIDPTVVTYRVPPGTASQWIAVYPEGSTTDLAKPKTPAEQAPAGAGTLGGDGKSDFMKVQLPSSVWLPVNPGDSLEVRVATYGEERQRVRWMTLHSPKGTVRPEVSTGGGGGTSITRGFYYLGYEVAYDIVSRTVVRHYSAREDYKWALRGMWAAEATYPPTNVNELREVAGGATGPIPLALTQDHVRWTLPDDMAKFGTGVMLSATVTGTADFKFRTKQLGGPNPADKTETSKGGDINILVQVW